MTGSAPAYGDIVLPPAPPADKAELAAADSAVRAKDWGGALVHFQAALKVAPSQRAELGMADSLYRLGRVGEAYEAYDEAQRTYGAKCAGTDKATVTSRLAELATKTGWLSIRVGEAGADVTVDGKPFGVSPVPALVRVPVGPHDVSVTKAGSLPYAGRAEVAPDGKAVVDVALAVAPTQGHLIVRANADQPLRVLVDGVDVGATPWEGDLPPGIHEVTGRSSTAAAAASPVAVVVGASVAIDLVSSSTAAHIQLRTSDGKGLITVDGAVKGEGAFAGDVSPGVHAFAVTLDGYRPFQKSLTLAPQETWAETVTLEPIAAPTQAVSHGERSFEGFYGGFSLLGALGVGGQGTELETNCDTLGASSCSTPSPTGGGVAGYLGWTWNPVGFELFLAASADQTQQTAHFNGTGGASGMLPFADPARDEKFNFYRVGGLAAVRVRASVQGRLVRGTIAGGVGLSYKAMFMTRHAIATDGTGREGIDAPDSEAHLSPAVTVEGAIQFRVTPTLALAVGLSMWADNASIAGTNSSPPSSGHALVAAGQTPAPIPTPEYHFASGPQVFLLPFIGMQFGP